MARSLRSKRRQKNNRIRRKKFGERETLKAWDHYRSIRAREHDKELTQESECSITSPPIVGVAADTPLDTNEEVPMELDKITKRDVAKWALSRNQKKKLGKIKKIERKKKKYNKRH